ncbi:uncharacterized protein A4U43_C01F1990 [Asparagus officinalis]|uniref:AT-hook motif nuclear-localized protein n=1 Tax=Asparagus officinalis TaxID=4686 RepID=A0A5P1FLP6_ASPOF|nr:uncharacterized protein A4U43_C01F1990 [Asparagus officinalis]
MNFSSLTFSSSIAIFCFKYFPNLAFPPFFLNPNPDAMVLIHFFTPIRKGERKKNICSIFWFLLHFFVPMEARAETSNASGSQNPPLRSPAHRLQISMNVLPDGTGGSAQDPPLRVSLMKKRGRPRKSGLFEYVPGGVIAGTSSTTRVPSPLAMRGLKDNGFVNSDVPVGIMSLLAAISALGSEENAFTPYTIDVKAGQGRFEILSISGLLTKSIGPGSKIAGVTIMLAGPNGKVFGGRLSSLLIDASSVQSCNTST